METVPSEPMTGGSGNNEGETAAAAMETTVPDPSPSAAAESVDREASSTAAKMAANNGAAEEWDSARCLRLSGLPTSLQDESVAAFSEAIVEILNKTFGIPHEAVDRVQRFPLKAEHKDDEAAVAALVTFRSRVHKHRVYTQRAKLEAPMAADLTTEWPTELSSAQEDEILANSSDFVVSDEVGEDLDEQAVLGGDGSGGEMNEEQQQQKNRAANGDGGGNIREANGSVVKNEPGAVKAEVDEHPEVDENGEPLVKEEGDETNKGRRKDEPVIDWDGAPEFQWKTTVMTEDRFKLILDNVSVGDFENPWLYQTILRAKHIDFNCINTSFKNTFDHNPLRKGRLTLTFHSDNQAMAQAVNGLVCLRTRPNKRLKIYLPQTNTTLRMKGLLERKLGRVIETNLKSRQLLVRAIDDDVTEDDVKTKLAQRSEDVEKVEIRNDSMERRCAIVTFTAPELAIRAHMKNDEVRLGPKGRAWTRVYYMQDIVLGSLLTKTEAKHAPNKQQQRPPPLTKDKKKDEATATPTKKAADDVVKVEPLAAEGGAGGADESADETAAATDAGEGEAKAEGENAAAVVKSAAAVDGEVVSVKGEPLTAVKDEPKAASNAEKGIGEAAAVAARDGRNKRPRSRSPGRQRKRGRGPPRASSVAAAKISFSLRKAAGRPSPGPGDCVVCPLGGRSERFLYPLRIAVARSSVSFCSGSSKGPLHCWLARASASLGSFEKEARGGGEDAKNGSDRITWSSSNRQRSVRLCALVPFYSVGPAAARGGPTPMRGRGAGGGYRSPYEQRGSFPNRSRGGGGGYGGGPMNNNRSPPRASPWANGPPMGARPYGVGGIGGGGGGMGVVGGGYRDMDLAIREQREQLQMQQQLLQQQEYISELAGELRKRKADIGGYSGGGGGGMGGGGYSLGRPQYQSPGMGTRPLPTMGSRSMATSDYTSPGRGYGGGGGGMDRGYQQQNSMTPHRPYGGGVQQPQSGGGYGGSWTR